MCILINTQLYAENLKYNLVIKNEDKELLKINDLIVEITRFYIKILRMVTYLKVRTSISFGEMHILACVFFF